MAGPSRRGRARLGAGRRRPRHLQVQGDTEEFAKPPVDLVPTVPAAGWPLLQLATAQAGWRNIPNWSQQEVLQILLCLLVV